MDLIYTFSWIRDTLFLDFFDWKYYLYFAHFVFFNLFNLFNSFFLGKTILVNGTTGYFFIVQNEINF